MSASFNKPTEPGEVVIKKGLWSLEEDQKLINFLNSSTTARKISWSKVPIHAGLARDGKSCRLRWVNYLRPGVKRGAFSPSEDKVIIGLHSLLGNQWSRIAKRLDRRTDNDIKNHWNTILKKRLREQGIDPDTHQPFPGFDCKISAKDSSDPKSLEEKLQNLGPLESGRKNFAKDLKNLKPSYFPSCPNRAGLQDHTLDNYRYLLQQEELLLDIQKIHGDMHDCVSSPSKERTYSVQSGLIRSDRGGSFGAPAQNSYISAHVVWPGIFNCAPSPVFDTSTQAGSLAYSLVGPVLHTDLDHSSLLASSLCSMGISQNPLGADVSLIPEAGSYEGFGNPATCAGNANVFSSSIGLEAFADSMDEHHFSWSCHE